jgi:two-component system cell cycle response regulator DivK
MDQGSRVSRQSVASSRSPGSKPSSSVRGNEQGDTADRDVPLILVVDDTQDTRELYAEVFAEAGFRVEQATNGQEALDVIAAHQPAVVLMDLSMPVMDGWEATKRIKGHPTTANVVVIALTAHATNLGLRRAEEAGADIICTKPCPQRAEPAPPPDGRRGQRISGRCPASCTRSRSPARSSRTRASPLPSSC